jgi:hypothetical protein
MSGFAPLKSCRARFDASMTSSNRLGTFLRQSSTVIRDMDLLLCFDTSIETDFSVAVKPLGPQQTGFYSPGEAQNRVSMCVISSHKSNDLLLHWDLDSDLTNT